MYVAHTVEVFREVRRVLKDDGTCWINLGDSFARDPGKGEKFRGKSATYLHHNHDGLRGPEVGTGLKPKDLCGIPWRVAFALQADGWYLRSDIVWAKSNPMPESVTDRPTRSHEYVFLLAKAERYFYDAAAIMEPASAATHARIAQPRVLSQLGGDKDYGPDSNRSARRTLTNYASRALGVSPKAATGTVGVERQNASFTAATADLVLERNKRDVWTINSEATPEAHFATFPQKLVEPCILAGTSAKGECSRCGKNWVRVTERVPGEPDSYHGSSFVRGKTGINGMGRASAQPRGTAISAGWRPTCACSHMCDTRACNCGEIHRVPTRPNLVLDPFVGAGTVGVVCERLGRRWVGVELSAEYITIAKRRTAQRGLFTGIGNEVRA